MKYLLITLAIIFSSVSLIEAQWTIRNINTTFTAASIINDRVAIAGCDIGVICKTTDCGENWTYVSTGDTNTYQSFYFKDENNGWTLAYHYSQNDYSATLIMKTTDGGRSWIEKFRCTDRLYSFSFVNDTLAVAVGDNGTILRTADGGENWKKIVNNQVIQLNSVHFINEKQGCIVGYSGLIMKTSDGGLNWTVVRKDFNQMNPDVYYSVCFSDSNTAWAVGSTYDNYGYNYSRILKSTDGGNTWAIITLGPKFQGHQYQSIYFSDSQNGRIVFDGYVIWTSDGGNNWQLAQINGQTPTVLYPAQMNSAIFKNNIGIGFNETNILMSKDGGKSWKSSFACQNYYITSMCWLNSNMGWANGDVTLKTTDGGKHWNKLSSAPGFNNIYFADSLTGFGSNNTGIYKTVDGGNTWKLVHTPSSQEEVMTMYFLNKNTGWATEWYGIEKTHMVKTTDGGNTWTSTPLHNGIYFNKYFFLDENNGYVIDNGYIIKKTIDGGNSWTDICWSRYIQDIFFLDVNTGWAVGSNGMVWIYDGSYWNSYSTGVNETLRSVYFIDRNNGWAVGDHATIVHTADGGKTWTQQSLTPKILNSYDLYSIAFPSKNRGFAFGNGIMLEYSNPTSVDPIVYPVDNYYLAQNYPNPFNPSTNISYTVPVGEKIKLTVFNILGQEVTTLVNEYKPAGNYTVKFNAFSLPSGVYIYSIQAGEFRDEKKLVLLR